MTRRRAPADLSLWWPRGIALLAIGLSVAGLSSDQSDVLFAVVAIVISTAVIVATFGSPQPPA